MNTADFESMATGTARTTRHNYASVDVTVDQVTPLYDNLLVRRLDWDETPSLIVSPDLQQTLDGRWVRKPDTGPRRGVVVAAGRGDKLKWDQMWQSPQMAREGVEPVKVNLDIRLPMSVKVGDVIIYPRFESSHVVIGGERYTFVHEADVMAVLEP